MFCPPGVAAAQIHKGAAGWRDQVQSCFDSLTAAARCLSAGYSFRVVDPIPLGAAEDLYKSLSMAAGDRKYFSGASRIKIADKEHPLPGLRDSKMF